MNYSSDMFRQYGPHARQLIRGGWWTVGGGALLAFVSTAVLGQGASRYEETASIAHRVSLVVMLAGFVIAILGYQLRQLARRSGESEFMPEGKLGDRSVGPFDDLPGAKAADEQRRLRTAPPEYTRASALTATRQDEVDSRGPVDVVDAVEVIDADESAKSTEAAAATADVDDHRDLIRVLRPILGITVVNAVGLLFPLLSRPAGPLCSALANWVMAALLVTMLFRNRGYVRVFAMVALLPTSLLVLFSLRLIEIAQTPNSWYASSDELWDVLRLTQLIGWLSIVPLGGVGTALWNLFLASTASRDGSRASAEQAVESALKVEDATGSK